MSWEFPAVSHTRIDFWKEPQFTRKGMLIFTAIFGIFGLHHLLFRSPQTWILFFLANIFSLGYFYWYDLIQLWVTPIEELNKYGLHSPLGPLGLAQGMFTYIPVFSPKPTAPSADLYSNPLPSAPQQGGSEVKEGAPNPWWFFLYSLLLPLQPLAKYIAGDSGYAITSLLSLTIIPLGWLYSIFMLGSEYFYLFLKPKQVFEEGLQRIFPFTFVWLDQNGHSKRLTGKEKVEEKDERGCAASERDGFFITLIKNLLSAALPYLRLIIPPEVTLAIESAIKTKEMVVDKAINIATKGTKIAAQVGKLAENIPAAATKSLGKIQKITTNPKEFIAEKTGKTGNADFFYSQARMREALMNTPAGDPKTNKNEDPQQGGGNIINNIANPSTHVEGGSSSQVNYWDYAAIGGIGAVLGAGFLLHTGRSFFDAVHKYKGTSDEPPNA